MCWSRNSSRKEILAWTHGNRILSLGSLNSPGKKQLERKKNRDILAKAIVCLTVFKC